MIAVVGCGNLNRSDDGVGPAVIAALRTRRAGNAGPALRLIDAGTDGMAAMFAARGCTALVVVDACRSGSDPGALFEVPGDALARPYAPALNLHDFRWDHALDAGRRIFREAFPAEVTVLLIEAASTDFGLDLSPPVAAAAERAVARIEALVAAHVKARPASP